MLIMADFSDISAPMLLVVSNLQSKSRFFGRGFLFFKSPKKVELKGRFK